MLFWRGLGILVLFIVIGCVVAAVTVSRTITHDADYPEMHGWVMGSGFFVAAIICWLWSRYLAKKGSHDHSLCSIPIQWWGPLLLVAGIGLCTIRKTREEVHSDRQREAAEREDSRK